MGYDVEVTMDYLDISETRSRHEDTNWATLALESQDSDGFTNPTSSPAIGKGLGDCNNGQHSIGLTQTLHVEEGGTLTIVPYVHNGSAAAGNGDAYLTRVRAFTNNVAAGVVAGTVATALTMPAFLPLIVVGGALAAALTELVGEAWSLLNPNCDGPVICGTHLITWDTLLGAPASGAQVTYQYPGYESHAGCGRNSQYTATYTIVVHRPHPECQTLSDQIRDLDKRIAALRAELEPGLPPAEKARIAAQIKQLSSQRVDLHNQGVGLGCWS